MKIDKENLTDIGYFFEKERGVYDEYVEFKLLNSPINQYSTDEILHSVSSFIKNNMESEDEILPAAIDALGKSNKKQYRELYLDVMRNSQTTNPSACFFAALASESIGFQVFTDKNALVDEESILKFINEYLVKLDS